MGYVELQVTTNFTFLRGASHPEEYFSEAARLGYEALAVTDRNSLAGIVRAHVAAKKYAVRLIPGCRLDFLDGPSMLVYPTYLAAYGRLSSLLTQGNLRAEKGSCHLYYADLFTYAEGLCCILLPPDSLTSSFALSTDFMETVQTCRHKLGRFFYLGASKLYRGDDAKMLFRLQECADRYDTPLVALGDVHFHVPERRQLQDVLTCIREKCTITTAGFRLHANGERHLKPVQEVARLFRNYPDALHHAEEIARRCQFSLDELKYVYPEELTADGRTPQEELVYLTWQGAQERFGLEITPAVQEAVQMELDFIARKNYASYFLTVHDYVRFARNRGILCQGRGSAANSVVCYCLGITSVDPKKFRLLFARFMSDARDEPPDIDVDFEHERREEVIQYIYEKYGRDRAAIVATVTQVRAKGALRDVGKVMGLSQDVLGKLSASISGYWQSEVDEEELRQQGFDLNDPLLQKVLTLVTEYVGFPRQLGQHTGGFVITDGPLHQLCPIIHARMDQRTNLEWNKDDLEALGFLKVDVLALGMLTCVRKAFDLVKSQYGQELTLAGLPQQDDPKVYDMICKADTLGVFQIESRAQMSMLPRLRPREFYDLVIEVAIVRPGPIQGDMVHPYLRRRNLEEDVDYPSDEVRGILKKTLGVPLFQEQAMEIAIVAAGFSPAEADALRRSMATFKAKGEVSQFHQKMVSGMLARGYSEEFANRVFRQLEGFGSYGFPESHAASFALLVYVSCYIKCYYPDVFATALLNSQPMGFYQPAQIIIDARKHGVVVLPIDVNHSNWDNTLEAKQGNYYAVRLGFRQVKGVSEQDMQYLVQARENQSFSNVTTLAEIGLSITTMEQLADADAFQSLGLDRRQALWEIAALGDRPTALFQGQPAESVLEGQTVLPLLSEGEQVIADYAATGLTIRKHPVGFLREQLELLRTTPADTLRTLKNGTPVRVCGLVTVRQRPGTAKGVLFVTIEDETAFANVVVWAKVFERDKRAILRGRLLMVDGHVQIEGEVVHVVARRCVDVSKMLTQLATAAEASSPESVFHKGRNFH